MIERRKFISFEKNKYTPTSLGLQFYDTIKEMEVVNVGETAKLEFALKNVAEGKISEREFYHKVSDYVRIIVSGVFSKEQKISVEPKSTQRKNLGTCPQCRKGNIIEGKNAFGCSEWKQGCKFAIWKEITGKKLTAKNVEDLLQKKKTSLIKGFKSKAGKSFDAYLTLNNELKIGFEFPVRKK